MITRAAIPSSGGPTFPTAVRTFATEWQLPQPYSMNIASPRAGSPPVIAAAWTRACARSCAASHRTATSATTSMAAASSESAVLTDRDRMAFLRRLQPFVEHRQCGDPVHEPARNPHQQPGELLIGDRIEADSGHAHRRIVGIPGGGRKAHQRAERSANQRSEEEAGSRNAVSPADARVQ